MVTRFIDSHGIDNEVITYWANDNKLIEVRYENGIETSRKEANLTIETEELIHWAAREVARDFGGKVDYNKSTKL